MKNLSLILGVLETEKYGRQILLCVSSIDSKMRNLIYILIRNKVLMNRKFLYLFKFGHYVGGREGPPLTFQENPIECKLGTQFVWSLYIPPFYTKNVIQIWESFFF